MHLILIIIGIILLLVFVPLLIVGLVLYTKLRTLWYKITGRQPQNPFGGFTGSFNSYSQQSSGANRASQNAQQNAQQQSSQTGSQSSNKKIFSDNEGEYVDFEVVD